MHRQSADVSLIIKVFFLLHAFGHLAKALFPASFILVRSKLRTNRNTGAFLGFGLKVFPAMPEKAKGAP